MPANTKGNQPVRGQPECNFLGLFFFGRYAATRRAAAELYFGRNFGWFNLGLGHSRWLPQFCPVEFPFYLHF